jgi:hypothetical protein
MKHITIIAAGLALAVTSAQAAAKKTLDAFSEGTSGNAYREGVSDWLGGGLCYRARPYLTEGTPEQAAAWERGWQDAKRRVPEPVEREDDSACFPGRQKP